MSFFRKRCSLTRPQNDRWLERITSRFVEVFLAARHQMKFLYTVLMIACRGRISPLTMLITNLDGE